MALPHRGRRSASQGQASRERARRATSPTFRRPSRPSPPLEAEELRGLIREMISWLDHPHSHCSERRFVSLGRPRSMASNRSSARCRISASR